MLRDRMVWWQLLFGVKTKISSLGGGFKGIFRCFGT